MGLLLLLAMPAAAQHLQMKIGGGFASIMLMPNLLALSRQAWVMRLNLVST